MDTSIVIVTKNRAEDLARTLGAMKNLRLPAGMKAEIMVVDNGSTDDTANVVFSAKGRDIPVRYMFVPTGGKTAGLNRGIAATKGNIIVMTDDDVRPPLHWLSEICEPIVQERAEAVCGGVCLASHLVRPWMSAIHRSWLADTNWVVKGTPLSLVGANMAFSRGVLARVAEFDEELGPGASGFGDDHLFAQQLLKAGYVIADKTNVKVEHHFDFGRLKRECWVAAAEKFGVSEAYIGYHWEHWGCRFGKIRLLRARQNLLQWRTTNRDKIEAEGCCDEELKLIHHWSTVQSHLRFVNCERKYTQNGLVKLRLAEV